MITITLTDQGLADLRFALDHCPGALLTEEVLREVYERDAAVTAQRHQGWEIQRKLATSLGFPSDEHPWSDGQRQTARRMLAAELAAGRIGQSVHDETLHFYGL